MDDNEMTDDLAEAETVEVEEVEGETPIDKQAPKQLRDALKREKEKSQRLETEALLKAFQDLGLDPRIGMGKAAAMIFDGEPHELEAFMQVEFDYTGPAHPYAETIQFEQKRLDNLGARSTSIAPPSEGEALAKAEAEGDWETAGRIKAKQMQRMFGPQR